MPPTNSASVNCQPRKIQITSPSSKTRFVDANWNAIAATRLEPFWKSDFAIAIAAYEHDDDAAPSAGRERDRARPAAAERAVDAACAAPSACTIAESRKPSTSAHQTSHAMRAALSRPSTIHIPP